MFIRLSALAKILTKMDKYVIIIYRAEGGVN